MIDRCLEFTQRQVWIDIRQRVRIMHKDWSGVRAVTHENWTLWLVATFHIARAHARPLKPSGILKWWSLVSAKLVANSTLTSISRNQMKINSGYTLDNLKRVWPSNLLLASSSSFCPRSTWKPLLRSISANPSTFTSRHSDVKRSTEGKVKIRLARPANLTISWRKMRKAI